MITENDKRKIQEFITATSWTVPDWTDENEVTTLLDILKAFNNDPQTAIQYWKAADQKSSEAMRQNYANRLGEIGLTMEKKISNDVLLAYFDNSQQAVNDFKNNLRVEGQRISKQVFYDNFTVVVAQILGKKHSVQ